MDNVSKISDLLAQSWRNYAKAPTTDQGLTAYRNGLTLIRTVANVVSKEALLHHDALLTSNMSWFNPINKRYLTNDAKTITGKIVGIVAAVEMTPDDVRSGKQGAGSEIAVVEMANALAKLGCSVYVFTNIDTKEAWRWCVPGKNPQYLPMDKPHAATEYIAPSSPGFIRCFSDLLLREPGDVCLDYLIVWRSYSLKKHNFNNYSKYVIFWSHDVASSASRFAYDVDGVYCLTEWHKQQLSSTLGKEYNYVVGCNGTMVDVNVPVVARSEIDHFNVCYASNYVRGLSELLSIWPSVFKAVPRAKLYVYYGRETWGQMTEDDMALLVKKLHALKAFGVTEMCETKMMPHLDLIEEFKRMSVLCYPYIGESETFSIVSAAAQQTGVITCVRRKHGLTETCSAQPKDLLELTEIRDYLIELLKTPESDLRELREKHHRASIGYTWENAAKIMLEKLLV